ncbi:MAG: ABC transporter permease [Lachnospiraceae bacterium]
MEKNKLSGFVPVFLYTLKSQMKSSKYKVITFIFALLLIVGVGAVVVITSAPDEETEFNIKKVSICDETGLGVPEYAAYAAMFEDEQISGISFESCTDAEKYLTENEANSDYVLVVQKETEEGFILEIVTAEDSTIDTDNLVVLGENLSGYFQMFVYGSSGLSEEALSQALIGVSYQVSDFGDEEIDTGKEIVTIIVVMVFLMVVYFMILMYGQQICAEVSIEKTTKLVEQLLVSVTPYGLVSGKILAVITASIAQFAVWVVSLFIGIFGGDKLAASMYEGYVSKFSFYMDYLKDWFGEMAFGVDTIILAVLLMIAGLVFYLIIAGVAGSMVTKPEDTSNVQIVFVMPLIISFFFVLFAIISGEGFVSMAYHFIPFTSAMVTPGAVLLGDISVWGGIVSLLITIVGSMLLLWIAAKVYKSLLFYTGKKISFKAIFAKK